MSINSSGTTIILGAYYMFKMYRNARETNAKVFADVSRKEVLGKYHRSVVLFGCIQNHHDLITPSLENILTQINRIN
jgi:NADH-quinone oxidoreductase subunit M